MRKTPGLWQGNWNKAYDCGFYGPTSFMSPTFYLAFGAPLHVINLELLEAGYVNLFAKNSMVTRPNMSGMYSAHVHW